MLLLSGCGFNVEQHSEEGSSNPSQDQPEINTDDQTVVEDGSLSINLVTDTFGKYILSVQNDSSKDVTLTFPSSQVFDYTIGDQNGEVLHTYSANKSFLQSVSKKTLKPGDKLDTEVDISEHLALLDEGKYKLTIWLATSNPDNLKASIKFDYNGEDSLKLKSPFIGSAEVTFHGMIDNHSIEVKRRNGETEVFQIPESLVQDVEGLTEGDIITIKYFVNKQNQQVIESISNH